MGRNPRQARQHHAAVDRGLEGYRPSERSSRRKGSRKDETVTIEFDASESAGTISVTIKEDRLVGTWSAGDDGGPVDVKKVAAKESAPKDKS